LVVACGLAALAPPVRTLAQGQAQPPPGGEYWQWQRDPQSLHWAVARAHVGASPAAVFARLQQVDDWRALFSDIRALTVVRRDGGRWVLRVTTEAFDCGEHTYYVQESAARALEVRIDAPGVDALARLSVREGPVPDQAVIDVALFAETTGTTDWYGTARGLRERQERMVSRYAADLLRAFGAPLAR
jgi:hypothetical protein